MNFAGNHVASVSYQRRPRSISRKHAVGKVVAHGGKHADRSEKEHINRDWKHGPYNPTQTCARLMLPFRNNIRVPMLLIRNLIEGKTTITSFNKRTAHEANALG